jgi:hypothetical protein
MNWRGAGIVLLSLMITMSFGSYLRAEDSKLFCFPKEDAQKIARIVEEREILLSQIETLKRALELKEEEVRNLERQVEFQKQIALIESKRAEVERLAYERERDLTTRALKLAEISRGSQIGDFKLMGLVGAVAFALGLIVGR